MTDTILVVDDTPDVAHLTASCLVSRGYDALIATNGEQALQLAAATKPSCILLDVRMGQTNGIEVMKQLRENPATSGIPIILVTANARQEDMLSGYKEGADYYITKPFSAAQLIYGIRLVLGRLEENPPAHGAPGSGAAP